jgi:hypothetical protein
MLTLFAAAIAFVVLGFAIGGSVILDAIKQFKTKA